MRIGVSMDATTQNPAASDSSRDLRFPQVFEAAAIGMGICHFDGRILEANSTLGRMLGYDRNELAGIDPWKFHGAELPGADPAQDNNNGNDSRLLAELMRCERDSFAVEKRFRRKDGSEFWGQLTVSLARNAHGEPAFLVALLEDATERKRVEESLRQAEKMEVIGRLAGGIAHDFNNLLTGILLYCDLMLSELEPEDRLRHHVEEVRMAGEQGAALAQQLLAMARKQAAEPRALPINEIVASTENLLRRLIGEQIELVTALDPSAGMVFADPAQLRQILLNLVLNARDALGQPKLAQPRTGQPNQMPSGRIQLSTRVTEFPRNLGPGNPRPAVSLIVEDDGCGMNAETRARLFEPFFTTKRAGEGTGMGLATVQRIVSESGGLIEVASEPGRGTRMEVFLPALEAPKQACSPDSGPNTGKDGRKTILLVDDHATVRRSVERVLVREGYRILEAAGGEEALRAFADNSAAIDLLIADCMMPGMNGRELAERLRRVKPELKVLLISGHPRAQEQAPAGASPLMHKPFSGSVLVGRVREVLDRFDDEVGTPRESHYVNRTYCACIEPCPTASGSEFSQPADPRRRSRGPRSVA